MKILLHICCGPCACYPVERLQKEQFEIYGYWYNPNIHPYTEYRKRLENVIKFAEKTNLHIIYQDEYELEEYLRQIAFREEERCRICYYIRLENAARIAKRGKFDYYTSTLLYSKFQKHELIKEIGIGLGKKFDIPFYYEDFRIGWQRGIKISKKYKLYRQQYCGCIYSEKERYYTKEFKLNGKE